MLIPDPIDDDVNTEKNPTKGAEDKEKARVQLQALGLLNNAIDFFKRAMVAIDTDPKASIINFSTAVELILKFPLMLEHWSLIVAGEKRKLNRQKFIDGDFQSTTFDETVELLNGVFNVSMDDETKDILDKIRSHRNRMVHYFKNDLNNGDLKRALIAEQAIAWFKLNRFLKKNSKKLKIDPYQQHLDELEKQLIAYSKYAEQKFNSLIPKIEGLKQSGVIFEWCQNCEHEAMQFSKGDFFDEGICLVCDSTDHGLQVKCPKCDVEQILLDPNYLVCKECTHEVSGDAQIFDLLDETRPNYDPDDYKPNITPANCLECEAKESVCLHKGKYLCIHCWKVSLEIYRCGYCNEPMNIDVEDSHFDGCPFCEGYMSHMMSKDLD